MCQVWQATNTVSTAASVTEPHSVPSPSPPWLTGLVIESPAAALNGRVRTNASQNNTMLLMLVR